MRSIKDYQHVGFKSWVGVTREAQRIKSSIKQNKRGKERKNIAKEHSEHEKSISLYQQQKTPVGHSLVCILHMLHFIKRKPSAIAFTLCFTSTAFSLALGMLLLLY